MKVKVLKQFSADLDMGNVEPGEYDIKVIMARGEARNAQFEPAAYLGSVQVSIKHLKAHIRLGNARYVEDKLGMTTEEKPMETLPAVQQANAVLTVSPQEQINQASDMARILKEVVTKAGLAKKLGGRKEHLEYEAWATIARWFQCTPITEWTRPIKEGEKIIGWEARVNVVDNTGRIIGTSEGMCMSDEQNWRGKPSYALRSMAQTRTAGKVLRSLFAHIAVLAGYSPTPAEEMDGIHTESKPTQPEKPKAPSNGAPTAGDTPKDNEAVEFIPSAILKKEGETKGKPWTRFTIVCGNDKYVTFNKSFAELAKAANIEGTKVRVVYRRGERGNDIELVTAVEARQVGDGDE